MIRHEVIRLSSQHLDGSLMYPGLWLRTWVQVAGTRTWICASVVPYQESQT